MVTRTGQDRTNWHLNLTFQVTCDWQLLQFLRCFEPSLGAGNVESKNDGAKITWKILTHECGNLSLLCVRDILSPFLRYLFATFGKVSKPLSEGFHKEHKI